MKCFYHISDMDGWCSAAIVAKCTGDKNKDNYIGLDFNKNIIKMSMVHQYLSPGETVYISDYSFTEKTMDILDAIIDKVGIENVHWNDHHDSSIALCQKYEKYSKIPGARDKKHSGALLTYIYLQKKFSDKLNKDIPAAVLYVSDWDTFQHKNGIQTKWFKYGIDSDTWYKNPLSTQWEELLKYGSNVQPNIYIDKLMGIGKIIYEYVMAEYSSYCKANVYESRIGDTPIAVINRSANSLIFGELYEKYAAVCTFCYDGENYKHTLYSNERVANQFDCRSVAEQYGGGGHRGAAGFSTNKIIFEKTADIVFDVEE